MDPGVPEDKTIMEQAEVGSASLPTPCGFVTAQALMGTAKEVQPSKTQFATNRDKSPPSAVSEGGRWRNVVTLTTRLTKMTKFL